jgi:hypothetical protein
MMLALTSSSAVSVKARVYNAAAASTCRRHSACLWGRVRLAQFGLCEAHLDRRAGHAARYRCRTVGCRTGAWDMAAARTNVAGIIVRLPNQT